MKDLIEALQIFLKYGDERWPTHCEHDVLMVCMDPDGITEEDIDRLEYLSFTWSDEHDCFISYRFGSA